MWYMVVVVSPPPPPPPQSVRDFDSAESVRYNL
jgi:hypothetical protein